MSRLTEYANMRINDIERYIKHNKREQEQEFFANKELELFKKAKSILDLEQELSCPLDVVFKALKEGVLHKEPVYDDKIVFDKVALEYDEFEKKWLLLYGIDFSNSLYLKDYGKTWWLKGEKRNV